MAIFPRFAAAAAHDELLGYGLRQDAVAAVQRLRREDMRHQRPPRTIERPFIPGSFKECCASIAIAMASQRRKRGIATSPAIL